MHRFNNNVVLQGMLALLAFALLLVVAAQALQPQDSSASDPVLAASLQDPQQPASVSVTKSPDPSRDGKAAPASVFHGTIAKDGSDFVFRDQSGTVYRLDAAEQAKPFAGKTVELTGQIEKNANLIHVQHIEKVTA